MAYAPVATNDDSSDLQDILHRDIPWETYMTARLISDKDLQLIRRYDKRSEELQASLLDEVRFGCSFRAVLLHDDMTPEQELICSESASAEWSSLHGGIFAGAEKRHKRGDSAVRIGLALTNVAR